MNRQVFILLFDVYRCLPWLHIPVWDAFQWRDQKPLNRPHAQSKFARKLSLKTGQMGGETPNLATLDWNVRLGTHQGLWTPHPLHPQCHHYPLQKRSDQLCSWRLGGWTHFWGGLVSLLGRNGTSLGLVWKILETITTKDQEIKETGGHCMERCDPAWVSGCCHHAGPAVSAALLWWRRHS